MARTASNKSTSSKKADGGKSKAASPAQKRAAKQAASAPAQPRIFDERTKRDITGVAVTLLGIVLFAIAGPVIGCLLAGLDRKITARMQGRVGPPLLQPYYDVRKLIEKDKKEHK